MSIVKRCKLVKNCVSLCIVCMYVCYVLLKFIVNEKSNNFNVPTHLYIPLALRLSFLVLNSYRAQLDTLLCFLRPALESALPIASPPQNFLQYCACGCKSLRTRTSLLNKKEGDNGSKSLIFLSSSQLKLASVIR